MGHTPGPWRVKNKIGYVYGKDVIVARVGDYTDKECLKYCKDRWDADTHLIAAAPDLLQELKNIAEAKPGEWEPEMRDQFREWAQNRARHAIAKATGK